MTSVPASARCSATRLRNGTAIPAGTFLDLGVNQPATDARLKGATPAFYYQGKGISCDNLPGYTKTGELLDPAKTNGAPIP